MSKSEKTRKIIALSAGAAVGLSATAIVLLQGPDTSAERVKSVQSALRDGATTGKVTADKSAWVRVAGQRYDGK
jgi:hypothetical protein